MKRLKFTFETALAFTVPVERHYFTLRCLPADSLRQRVLSETVTIQPTAHYAIQRDGFGNRLVCGELLPAHQQFTYRVEGLAVVDNSRSDPLHPLYKSHSGQCRPTPEIALLGRSAPKADTAQKRALALCRAAHEALCYRPGSTTLATTAGEALAQGAGVCQDYTQLLLTLLRLEGIPARYCCGLVPGTGTTHAWAEAWADGRWLGLDPTRGCLADEGYLLLSTGRDSRDCVVEQGVFLGNTRQQQKVFANLIEE